MILDTYGSLVIMARRIALQHHYPEPPERMREVLINREYLRDKLRAVGGPGAELVSWERDEHDVTVVLHHAVPEDALPSAVRSVLPDDLTIRRTESWNSSGGNLHAMIDGVPAMVTGTTCLEPGSTGCIHGTQLTAEVNFPLFSAKIETLIIKKVAALLETEYLFTLEWLCKSTV